MIFAKPGQYKACGLFSYEHFALIISTVIGIFIALKCTKINNKNDVKKVITKTTILVWILEIVKIIFNLKIGNGNNINTYVPLYYCSILLYAGIFSSIGKGVIKRVGDVFLATGGIVAGIVFIIFPTTSILTYPIFHYISMQSFIYHGAMIYLGIIINKYKYIKLEEKDILYYAVLILVICIIAYILNCIFDSNLMFISKDFPASPITILYKLTGKAFPIVMTVGQMTLPFYLIYGIKKLLLYPNYIEK